MLVALVFGAAAIVWIIIGNIQTLYGNGFLESAFFDIFYMVFY